MYIHNKFGVNNVFITYIQIHTTDSLKHDIFKMKNTFDNVIEDYFQKLSLKLMKNILSLIIYLQN